MNQEKADIDEQSLTPDKDIWDNELRPGIAVRSHDFALGLRGRKVPIGMDSTGEHAAWIEGDLLAIGKMVIEGCPRYSIKPRIRYAQGFAEELSDDHPLVFPPVNGTPMSLGGVACGVVSIDNKFHMDEDHIQMTEGCLDDFWDRKTCYIRKEFGEWWVSRSDVLGEDKYQTREEAYNAVFWEDRYLIHTLERNVLAESNLGKEWTVDFSEGISFIYKKGDHQFAIVGETQNHIQRWSAWCDDNPVKTYVPYILEAYQALINTKEWNQS